MRVMRSDTYAGGDICQYSINIQPGTHIYVCTYDVQILDITGDNGRGPKAGNMHRVFIATLIVRLMDG